MIVSNDTKCLTYISTRGGGAGSRFLDVLLKGLADDSGLFVPASWPNANKQTTLSPNDPNNYAELASSILSNFVGEDISLTTLTQITRDCYSTPNFRNEQITPLTQIGDDTYLMELFHGPTLAFKDLALQLLGRLFDEVLSKQDKKIHIVGATSGDTGSAAIEACRNRKNISITILHPHGRTSNIQRRQMTSIVADNVHNIAIEGTFDDCQNLVKQAFADEDLKQQKNISAINSINWARIAAQIVYYIYAVQKIGRQTAFAVPTGNFGNVYAAWAARHMGADIGPLVIGSNHNDVLTKFFETGEMQPNVVIPSLSPSMDIQISSNFERYLFECFDRDSAKLKDVMNQFKSTGKFKVSDALLQRARADFHAIRCSDDDTIQTIRTFYSATGIIIDPHTAVGLYALNNAPISKAANPEYFCGPKVAMACAHPAKFPDVIERAIGVRPSLPEILSDLMSRPEKFITMSNDYLTFKQALLSSY